ncbi:MAG: phosphoribosylglycinamide formyltransferase [Oxalobacter sp.]|nr:phosphoribosylglycinamide formyltransferase [Oxalobacter sp.]
MKNIVILISGRGSNMQTIVQKCKAEKWNARIRAVISNRADAAGLQFAEAEGIPTAVVSHKGYPDRESYDAALMAAIDGYQPDVVVLAGFMRILTAGFVEHYMGRLLNIHPSLLPNFRGLHTHQQAIDAGVRIHGATVHFVTPELDGGPIIAQAVVPVLPDDDEDTLADRVLEQEHQVYPRVVRWAVDGLVTMDGNGKVVLAPEVVKPLDYVLTGGGL